MIIDLEQRNKWYSDYAMNKLNLLKSIGFEISWKFIQIGLQGYYEIPKLLSYDEVYQYLLDNLSLDNVDTDNILSLISENDNQINFDKILNKLVEKDKSDIIIQVRKWKVYILKSFLDNPCSDYFQGILELIEYWTSVYGIKDAPIPFPDAQRFPNELYFTQSNYDILINKTKSWINKEISNIINSETNMHIQQGSSVQ